MLRRRYGMWAGNPNGYRESPECCAVEIPGRGAWGAAEARQCAKPRGHGPNGMYCKAHAKMLDGPNPPHVPDKTPTPVSN